MVKDGGYLSLGKLFNPKKVGGAYSCPRRYPSAMSKWAEMMSSTFDFITF